MSDYQKVIDSIQTHNLSWGEIARIELNAVTYEDFQARASFDTSNNKTSDGPVVRETSGSEKIVYVSEGGSTVNIEL